MAEYIDKQKFIDELDDKFSQFIDKLDDKYSLGDIGRMERDIIVNALLHAEPDDVRLVAEISDTVDEALDFLNSVSDQMPYHVYSALHDLICGICPDCGAEIIRTDDTKED